MKFTDRLKELGFDSYSAYLAGDHWKDFKKRYRENKCPMRCLVCNAGRPQLHHITYKRLGCERFADVVPLCRGHHVAVHEWLDANRSYKPGVKGDVKFTSEAVEALRLSGGCRVEKKSKGKRRNKPRVRGKKKFWGVPNKQRAENVAELQSTPIKEPVTERDRECVNMIPELEQMYICGHVTLKVVKYIRNSLDWHMATREVNKLQNPKHQPPVQSQTPEKKSKLSKKKRKQKELRKSKLSPFKKVVTREDVGLPPLIRETSSGNSAHQPSDGISPEQVPYNILRPSKEHREKPEQPAEPKPLPPCPKVKNSAPIHTVKAVAPVETPSLRDWLKNYRKGDTP